ncbi:cupin [Mycolicibacterium flavescens]|uniref:Cupin n=1 Tax=Mycolicibacterium flavescens TaxID=1776 RepID=A0A1E3RRB0_MYCFV|nr:cupin [Mycolicibacterium flavescens]MCV7279804.1 cupin [Mycolicibacterium flavescens]ODQ92433.1 cupin [Mycolicibacterium flavescens]
MTTSTALSLHQLADELITAAKAASAGRSARSVFGGSGKTLRQTVLALAADHGLDDHESPGEATLLVLRGRVRLDAPSGAVEGAAGDYLPIPEERHSLAALEDSAVLLTVVAK